MVLLCTLLLIGLYSALDVLISKQIFWLRNVCFGAFAFFGLFLIVSGALFAFGAYSLWLAYGVCFGIGALAAGLLFKRKIETVRFFSRKTGAGKARLWCFIGLLLLSAVVTFSQFEYRGMGQDQGVYATEALFRIAGYNDFQIDLDAYHLLDDEGDKALFISSIELSRHNPPGQYGNNLRGYYSNYNHHYMHFEPLSEVSGYFHGVPSYSAFLSISGLIFGLSGMLFIQTFLFSAAACLLFLTLSYNLKLKVFTSTVFTALFILSPLVLWTTKITLTESLITLLMVAFLFLITSAERYANKLLWLPVAVFSFLHVSAYTMMPMFVILFVLLYIQKRDGNIVISGVVSIAAYLGGFFMMLVTCNGYTMDNYKWLRRLYEPLHLLGYFEFVLFIAIAACAAAACLVLACYIVKRFDVKLSSKGFLVFGKYFMLLCLAVALFRWGRDWLDGAVPNSFEYVRAFVSAAPTITLVAFAFSSGFVILPIALFGLFVKKDVFASAAAVPAAVVFLYSVLVYSAFFKPETEYFYYYARYLAPFVPVILVMGGVYFDSFRIKTNVALSCVSVLLTLPFAFFVIAHKDKTRVEWDTLGQIAAAVDELGENDVVVVSKESMILYFLPLNALTDTTILPHEDFKLLGRMLDGQQPGGGRVFFLDRKASFSDPIRFDTWRSEYAFHLGMLPPLPMNAEIITSQMYLSEVTQREELFELEWEADSSAG